MSQRALVLVRKSGDAVSVVDPLAAGAEVETTTAALASVVSKLEAREQPRWVWDDTTHWYPDLLQSGLRVRYCFDLRLCRNILLLSPLVDAEVLDSEESEHWAALRPRGEQAPSLFSSQSDEPRLDTVAEFARHQRVLESSADGPRLRLLLSAESTAGLVAAEMTHAGLPWDAQIHNAILTDRLGPRPPAGQRPAVLEDLANELRAGFNAPALNPDSPASVLRALREAKFNVTDTRQWTLQKIDHPDVARLLHYKALSRLHTANGWNWLDAWVRNGRYRTQYLPGGVVTGHWAAVGGGALSLPVQLRPAVQADEGWQFVVADVAQLEPRVLAGYSGDENMARAAQARDLYQGLVDAGVVATRNDAKLAMLGAMYGATRGESAKMVTRLTSHYPRAFAAVEAAARAGERGDVVRTLLGRGSPRPSAEWVQGSYNPDRDSQERRAWGRFTRNFIIQGTGAEWALCWMAALRNRLWSLGAGLIDERPHLVFFLHDEVVVHTPAHLSAAVADAVEASAIDAGRLLFGSFPLDFPLDISVVENYAAASENASEAQ